MLAYAANRPTVAKRGASPNAMLAIIAIHVAGIAALMSAKMDLPIKIVDPPLTIDLLREDDPPPPLPIDPAVPSPPRDSTITIPPEQVPLPPLGLPIADATPIVPSFDDLIGPKLDLVPKPDPTPKPDPVKVGPRLATPASALRPPYPAAKLASGEEAVLRLSLTIDERGRVVAVTPVGAADRVFLDAARRHLLARWRYQPATEGGRAVGATIAVTLRFRLDG